MNKIIDYTAESRWFETVTGPSIDRPCDRCAWRILPPEGEFIQCCWSFPRGIPQALLCGDIKHDKPLRNLGQTDDRVFKERPAGWKVDSPIEAE